MDSYKVVLNDILDLELIHTVCMLLNSFTGQHIVTLNSFTDHLQHVFSLWDLDLSSIKYNLCHGPLSVELSSMMLISNNLWQLYMC